MACEWQDSIARIYLPFTNSNRPIKRSAFLITSLTFGDANVMAEADSFPSRKKHSSRTW